jgi:RNA ligase (TIGR02306 family)
MSELVIPITTVDAVKPHPNADRLEVAVVGGWQVCVGKGSMQAGDRIIYVQPDAMVPERTAELWGVAPYLGKDGRVKAIKLRGEPSFGFAVPIKDEYARVIASHYGSKPVALGTDVSAAFGITKYAPPVRSTRPGGMAGDTMPENPKFTRYTDMVNLRHYPDLFDGLRVVVTEKIHGTNSRVGVIDGERVAGSNRVQRRHPSDVSSALYLRQWDRHCADWNESLPRWKRWTHRHLNWPMVPPMSETVDQRNPGSSVYWQPWDIEGVEALLTGLGKVHRQVILYGEIYGPSIQALGYGVPAGQTQYRAFDLMLDGRYVDHDVLEALCGAFCVETVPVIASGLFSLDDIKRMSEGPTTLNGETHYREGVVVRTATEGRAPVGRLIAKYVSDTYLTGGGDAAEDLASDAQEAVA